MRRRNKALVFDIDGTLIPFNENHISQDVIDVLNSLSKEYYLFVATGRHALELKNIDGINFDAYITSDGQVITTKRGKSFISSIPKKDINNLVDYLSKNEVACSFTETDEYYINFINQKVIKYHEYVIFYIPEIRDINKARNKDILVVTIYALNNEVEDILKIMPHCQSVRWNQYGVDILNKNSGKGYGLKKICKYFKLDLDNVICFGDGENDISMFEICNKSCAMGDSDESLKKIATYVSTSAKEKGVINGLKYFKII